MFTEPPKTQEAEAKAEASLKNNEQNPAMQNLKNDPIPLELQGKKLTTLEIALMIATIVMVCVLIYAGLGMLRKKKT